MSNDPPGRRRLQRGDAKLIANALTAKGFLVEKTTLRVEASCPETQQYICGFYWKPATPATETQPATPSGWRFDISLADVFSVKDLKIAITEAHRVRNLVGHSRVAWQTYIKTRSSKRWAEYQGIIAALFLRQDSEDDES